MKNTITFIIRQTPSDRYDFEITHCDNKGLESTVSQGIATYDEIMCNYDNVKSQHTKSNMTVRKYYVPLR